MIPLWLVALGVVAFASDSGPKKKAPFKSITTTYTPPLPGEDPETPGRAPPPVTTLVPYTLVEVDAPADGIVRLTAPIAQLGKARLFRVRYRFTAVWNVGGAAHVACADGQKDYTYDPSVPDDTPALQWDDIAAPDWTGPAAPCGTTAVAMDPYFGTDAPDGGVVLAAILTSAAGPMAGYPTAYAFRTWVTNRS